MVKLIGALLVASSLLLLAAAAFVNATYGSGAEITGNAVVNIAAQPDINLSILDYLEGIMVSYSIVSFTMGILFLFRV